MVFSKTQLVSSFTAAMIVVAGFSFSQEVFAANTCCVYYKGTAKSNQCYDIAIPPTPGSEFECSLEADTTKKYSVNLSGGYTVDTSVEDKCISVPGYIEENILPSDPVCPKAKTLNSTEFLGKLADAKVAIAEASAKQAAQGFCCIAVGTAGSCSTPTLKSNILQQVKNNVLGTGIKSILPLPTKASDKKGFNLLQYFDCPAGTQYYYASCSDTTPLPEEDAKKFIGGAAALNNYSLANYCAIKDQVPYYCKCLIDGSACNATKYETKDKCLKDSVSGTHECLPLEKGKTKCDDLLKKDEPDQKPPDISVPFSVPDISELNKLGTTDITAVIGRVLKAALGIIGTIAFALFIYAGVLWMIAGGNSDRAQKSRDILVWTSLGIAVIFASYALVDIIFEVFR